MWPLCPRLSQAGLTQHRKITVENQRAAHFSSKTLGGETQSQRSTLNDLVWKSRVPAGIVKINLGASAAKLSWPTQPPTNLPDNLPPNSRHRHGWSVDRGKDALAIRVDGDTPTPSGMFLSRKQELASAMLGINQTALLPRYGGDLETPRQRQHTTSF